MDERSVEIVWHRVLEPHELPEGRVKPITCEHRTVRVTRFDGEYAALDNRCPHQGGPLGEESIENGFLRCPWHGWDCHPLTGRPPGGFAQYMAELTTAVKYSMNITRVLLNNGELAKISKEQRSGDYDVWQTTLHNPNFAEYARLCGAFGVRVETREELDGALERALEHDGLSLVQVITDPELV